MRSVNRILMLSLLLTGFLAVFISSCKKDEDTPPQDTGTVTDRDNNVYHTVKIGSYVWMVENLRVTHYNDGSPILNLDDNTAWQNDTTGAYCWYGNDAASAAGNPYGGLYNWYAVNSGKLCPAGWHIPTMQEWDNLTSYSGGTSGTGGAGGTSGETSGSALKEAGTEHWNAPNTGATNSSGFTAVAGGYRYSNGEFRSLKDAACWWCSSEDYSGKVYMFYLSYNSEAMSGGQAGKGAGLSVRCVKDVTP